MGVNWGAGASGAVGGAAAGSALGPWGAAAGGAIGGIFGLFGNNSPQAVLPKDLSGLRQQDIDLLHSFLSPGAFDVGGAGANFFGTGPNSPLNTFLASKSPEQQAYDTASPVLSGMLTGTGPQFERDIAAANSQGGRFGSANAILRGEALRNLFNMRTQVAGTLGTLASSAGNSTFNRLNDVQSQRLQLLSGLLGMSGQATLQVPVQNNFTNPNQQLSDLLKTFATLKGKNPISPGGGNGNYGGGTGWWTPSGTRSDAGIPS